MLMLAPLHPVDHLVPDLRPQEEQDLRLDLANKGRLCHLEPSLVELHPLPNQLALILSPFCKNVKIDWQAELRIELMN